MCVGLRSFVRRTSDTHLRSRQACQRQTRVFHRKANLAPSVHQSRPRGIFLLASSCFIEEMNLTNRGVVANVWVKCHLCLRRLVHTSPCGSQLPVRILHTDQNKWKDGSERFDFPPNVTRFRLEFVCFVGEKSENLDVDVSVILFDARVRIDYIVYSRGRQSRAGAKARAWSS